MFILPLIPCMILAVHLLLVDFTYYLDINTFGATMFIHITRNVVGPFLVTFFVDSTAFTGKAETSLVNLHNFWFASTRTKEFELWKLFMRDSLQEEESKSRRY